MENRVKIGEWIQTSFKNIQSDWQSWCLMMIVYFIPPVGMYLAIQFFQLKFGNMGRVTNFKELLERSLDQSLIIGVITVIAITAVSAFFIGGLYKAAFKKLEGEPIDIQDLFSGIDCFPSVLAASLVINILAFMGQLLCLFPAFIVQGLLIFTLPIIVKENLSPVEALQKSFETAKQDWLMLTVYAFAINLIAALGLFGCCVGILFTYPLSFVGSVVAYRSYFMPSDEKTPVRSRLDELYSKNCKNCGNSLDVRASFCDRCGTSQV